MAEIVNDLSQHDLDHNIEIKLVDEGIFSDDSNSEVSGKSNGASVSVSRVKSLTSLLADSDSDESETRCK